MGKDRVMPLWCRCCTFGERRNPERCLDCITAMADMEMPAPPGWTRKVIPR